MDLSALEYAKAEMGVLGTLLQNRRSIVDVAPILRPHHFHDTLRAADFEAMVDLWQNGGAVDLLTVPYHVHKRTGEPLEEAAVRISPYVNHVADSVHLMHHCAILVDLWKRRRIMEITAKMAMDATAEDADTLRGELATLMRDTSDADGYAEDTLAHLSYDYHNTPAGEKPMKWGISDLDDWVDASKGTVTILGGRPSSGKSAMALSMALNAAEKAPVWFLSLEMPKEDIVARMDAMMSGIPTAKIRTKDFGDAEAAAIAKMQQDSHEHRKNLIIHHAGHMSTVDFMAMAGRKVERDGVGLIVVDYMQLLTADGKDLRSEYDRVTHISQVIRRTAREFNVPVLALSQLKRPATGKDDAGMSDLRSSGQIEQDAHVILLLKRDDANTPDTITVNIVKNRNGMRSDVNVWCDLSRSRVGGKYNGWAQPQQVSAPHPDNFIEPWPLRF